MRPQDVDRERRDRSWMAALLGYGEFLIDAVAAFALIGGGTILLGTAQLRDVILIPEEKAERWTRWRAFAQGKHSSNIYLLPYSLVFM